MTIYVNDKATDVADGLTLQAWLESQGYTERKGVAVAVNGAVVSRAQWADTPLKDQDKIMLIGVFYGG